MFGYIVAALALASVADATFVLATATGAVTVTSATATSLALLGGVAILKGALLGLAARRGKRSAVEQEEEGVYAILAAQEPAQCYRRLICDLSAGAIPDTDKLVTLFNGEVSPVSAKFEFATAAKVGKMVKSAQACEVRYSCPLSTNEIQKIVQLDHEY